MVSAPRRYKYLDALTTAFVVILLVSNLIAQKVVMIGPYAGHVFGKSFSIPPLYTSGAMILFPITYIFGDVFTEVYGFARVAACNMAWFLWNFAALCGWRTDYRASCLA